MSKIYKDLDETKDILHKNMETLLDRGEKLDDLVDKSEGLSMSSKMFYKQAKKANGCCTMCVSVCLSGRDRATCTSGPHARPLPSRDSPHAPHRHYHRRRRRRHHRHTHPNQRHPCPQCYPRHHAPRSRV